MGGDEDAGVADAAIQGEAGAFSHAAAIRVLGSDARVLPCRTFEELFEAVEGGRADHGVVPVENSLAGTVQRGMDLLARHPLHAVAEARVRVRLCLVARPGVKVGDVRRAASHPVALQQCHGFFARHPEIEPVAAFDTAGSIRELMEGDAGYDAAIGSELAAGLHGAEILERDLEDDHQNYTRFLVVAREPADPPAEDVKTSLVFQTRHEPGALHSALGVFKRHGVDLTRLASRPIPGQPWTYRFFADVVGPSVDAQRAAVRALAEVAMEIRVLGEYREEPDPE